MVFEQQVRRQQGLVIAIVVVLLVVVFTREQNVDACFLPSHEQARLQLQSLLAQYPDLLRNNGANNGLYGNNQMMPNGQQPMNNQLGGGSTYPNNMQGNNPQNPYYGNQQQTPQNQYGGFTG